MPDRIPALDSLASQAKEAPMLAAEEVRRLGDHRRTRRHSAFAAGGLVVALVAGVGIWQSPLLDAVRPPDDAVPLPASPSPSEPPTEAPVPPGPVVVPPTWANAPTADDLFNELAPGEQRGESTDVADVNLRLCAPDSFGSPSTTLARSFGHVGFDTSYGTVVFGYDTAEEASAAYDAMRATVTDCDTTYDEAGYLNAGGYESSDQLDLSAIEEDADELRVTYMTAMGGLPNDPDMGLWTETVLVQADDRVLFISHDFEGMDNNCGMTPDDPAMQCVLAEKLPDQVARLTS